MPREISIKHPSDRAFFIRRLSKQAPLPRINDESASMTLSPLMIDVALALAAIHFVARSRLDTKSNATEQPSVKEPVTSIWKAFEKAPTAFTNL